MRRHKLVVHILVILSVFNFLVVLAAPVPVQEVREACADVVDGGEDVIIMSRKRAEKMDHPWSGHHGLTQASPRSDSESDSDYPSTSLQHPPGLPSTSNYASGVDQETTNPIQQPSSESPSAETRRPPYSSSGAELPWYGPGEMRRPSYASGRTDLPSYAPGGTKLPSYTPGGLRRPPYASGGTELPWQSSSGGGAQLATSVRTKPPWHSSGGLGKPPYAPGRIELPWYSSSDGRVQPATSVRTKLPLYSSGGTELPWHSSSGGGVQLPTSVRTKTVATPEIPPASSVGTETDKWVPTTEIETTPSSSGSSSSGQVTPASSSKVLPPSEQITPASSSKVPPPSEQITPASSSNVLPPSEQFTPASSSKVPPPSGQFTPASSSNVLPPSEQFTPASSSNVLPPSEQFTPASSSKVLPLSEEQDGYLAQTPTGQPRPQSKSVFSKVASKSKSFFRKLTGMPMSLCGEFCGELVNNPKLQIRIPATASGAVDAAA
jgi:hypothetical protein